MSVTGTGGRPLVVIAEPIASEAARWLAERAGVVQVEDPDGLGRALASAEALVVRTYTRVTAELLAGAPKLRVVGRAGVGLDNIDLEACAARGVKVVNTPDANTDAVAEYVISAVFAAWRPLKPIRHAAARDEWERLRKEAIAPREVRDATLGIWGMGKIGQAVARRGKGLVARVVYHDLDEVAPAARHGAEPLGPQDVLSVSDILTLHVDGRAENRHMIGAAELAALKPDALLINSARGSVVDTEALSAHLRRHPSAGAVVDVFDPEPFTGDCPLLRRPNALLTPHVGAATARAKLAMSWVVRDVWAALAEDRAG